MTNRLDTDALDFDGPDDGPEARALDRLIAEAARDYHRPPGAVPRDAMWEAIAATRAARATAPTAPVAAPVVAPAVVPGVVSLDAARARRAAPAPRVTRSVWTFAAAASLLLAAGVGMGRWWEGQARTAAESAAVAVVPNETRPATAVETGEPASSTPSALPGALASAESTVGSAEPGAPRTPRPPRVIPPRPSRPDAPIRRDDGGLAYDVATVRHLTSVEALLVSYRADPLDSLADARVAAWARTLLQDTRLLLDSPAASSPTRRRLFEDLELVLVQMARLAPADSTATLGRVRREREERDLIDGTMRDARVLPRLRNAIPAGVGS